MKILRKRFHLVQKEDFRDFNCLSNRQAGWVLAIPCWYPSAMYMDLSHWPVKSALKGSFYTYHTSRWISSQLESKELQDFQLCGGCAATCRTEMLLLMMTESVLSFTQPEKQATHSQDWYMLWHISPLTDKLCPCSQGRLLYPHEITMSGLEISWSQAPKS